MEKSYDVPEDAIAATADGGVQVDQERLAEVMAALRAEQSISRGLLAGIAAALVSALVWGLISKATGYEVGWIAIGVGFLVGFAVRIFGKGLDTRFQVMGAVLAGLAVALGRIVAVCMFASEGSNMGTFELLFSLGLGDMLDLLKETFSGMDLLFYGLAVWEGWQFSLRQPTPEELAPAVRFKA